MNTGLIISSINIINIGKSERYITFINPLNDLSREINESNKNLSFEYYIKYKKWNDLIFSSYIN